MAAVATTLGLVPASIASENSLNTLAVMVASIVQTIETFWEEPTARNSNLNVVVGEVNGEKKWWEKRENV